jgi:hypothetical protein
VKGTRGDMISVMDFNQQPASNSDTAEPGVPIRPSTSPIMGAWPVACNLREFVRPVGAILSDYGFRTRRRFVILWPRTTIVRASSSCSRCQRRRRARPTASGPAATRKATTTDPTAQTMVATVG